MARHPEVLLTASHLGLLALCACVSGPATLRRYPDGATETLEALKGQVMVLSFWAEWCKPCLEEFPIVAKAVEDASDGVRLLTVYYRQDPGPGSEVYRWLAAQPSSFSERVRWPSPAVLDRFDVRGLPRTYVLAPDGTVVQDFSGAILEDRAAALRDAIRRAGQRASTSARK